MKFEQERLLIIAPHADDEVLGCFGLINEIKKKRGKVFIQILTMGGYLKSNGKKLSKEKWKKEFLKVCKFLNIDDHDIAFFDDEERHLDTMPQSTLIDYVSSDSKISISKIKPTIVAIPTIFSTHQDHVQTYMISMSALRVHPQKIKHFPHMVLSYESPEYHFWSGFSEFGNFTPNFYLPQSKNQIQKKIKALQFYESQLLEGQRDGLKVTSLANSRGNEIGTDFAESYHIHRFFPNLK